MFQTILRDRNNTPFRILSALFLQTDSMEVAMRKYHGGFVSETDFRWFSFFWSWTAPRFTGAVGTRHDYAYKRLGKDAYHRRFERAKNIYARWIKTRFGEYLIDSQ